MIKQCAAIPSNDGGYCCEVGAGRRATWPESRCDRESRPARPFCLKESEKNDYMTALLLSCVF